MKFRSTTLDGWMDVSEEKEGEENPGEEDERTEEEDPKEQQVYARECEKSVDDNEGCSASFPFTPAHSDSGFTMYNDKASDEEDVSKNDSNNNIDAVCSNSFATASTQFLKKT